MPDARIQQTIVTPATDGFVVQLHISDAPLGAEYAQTVIQLTVRLPEYRGVPALAHYQRAAMRAAQDTLSPLLQRLATEFQQAGLDLEPVPRAQHRPAR